MKLDSLFRIQTLLLLRTNIAKSGYDLAKELSQATGIKPSSGKLYPFLHELKNNGYIIETSMEDASDRKRISYKLTEAGQSLIDDLVNRMGNILDARLEQMLDTCHHCGVKLYDSKVIQVVDGNELTFCCEHCMGAYRNPT